MWIRPRALPTLTKEEREKEDEEEADLQRILFVDTQPAWERMKEEEEEEEEGKPRAWGRSTFWGEPGRLSRVLLSSIGAGVGLPGLGKGGLQHRRLQIWSLGRGFGRLPLCTNWGTS